MKFGMSGHFVGMPARLHADAVINMKTGKGEAAMGSSAGVRQGACESPIPFPFTAQVALGTMELPVAMPSFRTRADGVTSGERPNSFL